MASSSKDFPPLSSTSVLGSPANLSYAANVAAPATKTPSFPVSFFSPGQKLSFKASDLSEGKDIWNSALIGYSLGPRPYYERLLKAMQKLWPLKGSMSLLSLADGFFLLKFTSSEDLESVLSGGPWFLLGKPFILQRWSPKFKPKRDEASPIPIWIKIVDFPLALWTPTGISRIASYIGIPISVDSLTANRSRLTFARVCVLISKDSVLHDEIPLEIDGEDMVLNVLYDWKPDRCEGCGSLIHPFSLCPNNPNPRPVLPLQPPKFRGRSTSRARTSRPHRSKSKAPTPPIITPESNTQKALTLIPPQVLDGHSSPQMPIPNLNNPTEKTSSSEHLIITRSLPGPDIPLVNKFASLQSDEGNTSNSLDSSSETELSNAKPLDDPPILRFQSNLPPKTRSIVINEKPPSKAKPPKGKSARKAKGSSS
ncbi:RNA exonuclease 1 [Dendrobium catenatum]|uniref:RNA exonuclease 1 n=1 Tax=Dendrobium catenatum TaxID=906689 RepID=A0A2I0WTJ6_9ASPA|nr:RNA exonuclease 1 [Dendrobium catenatum]